jgi:hypothetical protein
MPDMTLKENSDDVPIEETSYAAPFHITRST